MSARPSDRFIPWYFVLFFSVLAVIFTGFVYIAHTTHPGLVTDNAYEKGLKYNEVISRAEAQDSLNWASTVTVTHPAGRAALLLSFTLKDAAQKPLEGAKVSATLVRPARQSMDFKTPLAEQSAGVYTADLLPPAMGLWEVQVEAQRGKDSYQATKRVVLGHE